MKKNVVLCTLLFCTLLTGSAFAQRKLDERRAVVPNGFVRIFMLGGSVTVIGWDRDSLHVSGTVYESAGDRFALGVTPKGAKLGMWSDLLSSLEPSHITVRVPHRSQVWVKTTGADIRVSGVTGGLDLFSVSGAIEVGGMPREVYAETMGGRIVMNVTAAAARLKTANSPIAVRGSVEDLTAVTVSGAIDVAKTSFKRARLESVDGDIRYAGAIPAGSAFELTSHAGAIDLLLPHTVAAEFALSLYSGELVDEFGAAAKPANPKLKTRETSFSLGERSGARVTVRSFKGQVSLRKN
jgi:DUF4097 and DUF4098 domain-containing protein YvlB